MRIYYADVEICWLRHLKEGRVRSASLSRYKEREGECF